MAVTILIIEDESDLLELLEYNLQKEGFETAGFLSTKNVEQFLKEERVDLMIVDRNLPGAEGSEFVRELRTKGFSIPVIFLTAKARDEEIEEGFMRGADDYMAKPFNIKELILRIKAILKRTANVEEAETIHYRDIIIKPKSREVFIDGKIVELTKLEFDLLLEFIRNKNIVLSREHLLESIWGQSEYQERTVNVAINRLKEKIDPKKEKEYIKSIRGVGYTLC